MWRGAAAWPSPLAGRTELSRWHWCWLHYLNSEQHCATICRPFLPTACIFRSRPPLWLILSSDKQHLWPLCRLTAPAESMVNAFRLQVHHLLSKAVDPATTTFDPAAAAASVGGAARIARDAPVRLQLFLDHSALEVPALDAWKYLIDPGCRV